MGHPPNHSSPSQGVPDLTPLRSARSCYRAQPGVLRPCEEELVLDVLVLPVLEGVGQSTGSCKLSGLLWGQRVSLLCSWLPRWPFPQVLPLTVPGETIFAFRPPFLFTMGFPLMWLLLPRPLPLVPSFQRSSFACERLPLSRSLALLSLSGFGDPPSGHSLNVDGSLLPH